MGKGARDDGKARIQELMRKSTDGAAMKNMPPERMAETQAPDAPRVLLVDNEPQALDVYADVLTRWGYDVSRARSYTDAVCLLDRREYDVVVVELRMPDGSGFRLLEEIRASGSDCPVVATARIPSIGTVARAFKAGATDYIAKPFTAAELRTRIEEALYARSRRREEQSILRIMNEKAERLAMISSGLADRVRTLLADPGINAEIQSILHLSSQLAALGTKLVRRRSKDLQLHEVRNLPSSVKYSTGESTDEACSETDKKHSRNEWRTTR